MHVIQSNTIHLIQCSTIQYIQYNTIQYNTIQYNTIHIILYNTHNTIQYNTIQYNTIQYNTYNSSSKYDTAQVTSTFDELDRRRSATRHNTQTTISSLNYTHSNN